MIAKGPVEIWLSDLLRMQQSSLHTVIKLAYYSFSEPDFQLIPFLYEAPGQVIQYNYCLVLQMHVITDSLG